MLYSAAGALFAAAIAIAAWRRSRGASGYYDGMEYGMGPRAHLRYCVISCAFAIFFAISLLLQWTIAGIAGVAVFATIAVFYGASFLRGASHDRE